MGDGRGRRVGSAFVVLLALGIVVGAGPATAQRVIRGDDGAEMVLVPAGEFWMGSTRGEVDRAIDECQRLGYKADYCKGLEDELPRHRVALDGFYIDRYEVTNALYERFVRATAHRTTAEREGWGWVAKEKDGKWQGLKIAGAMWRSPGGRGTSAGPDHPVVQVALGDANAYCKWAGKRLPTEAEWEKAARGIDGRRYPWGEGWDPAKANGNMSVRATRPVGSYPGGVSPYDAHDMAGNVWEWVADWYDKDYYKNSPDRNPMGPAPAEHGVLRGGSWGNRPIDLRTTLRDGNAPDLRGSYIGFRCGRGLGAVSIR